VYAVGHDDDNTHHSLKSPQVIHHTRPVSLLQMRHCHRHPYFVLQSGARAFEHWLERNRQHRQDDVVVDTDQDFGTNRSCMPGPYVERGAAQSVSVARTSR
jgi:hypothetical protein